MTLPARHISISINCPAQRVYEFAANPANLPRWAAGLSDSIMKLEEEWITDSPMGRVKVKFVAKNPFGVMDHDVTLPSGETVRNPFRVLANGSGSEVVFTLLKRPGMSDKEFEADTRFIREDLEKLKALLET